MKVSTQSLPLVALISLASAQVTVTNDPLGTDIVTSYYSTCPSVTSTTITLPGTTTLCPNGICLGADGYPIITAEPTPITLTGVDGRETIYNIATTILPAICPGGVCPATYTLSEMCPCTAGPKTLTVNSCPEGFTTTVVECSVCAANGGPSTVTLTTPVPNGPYATQTPALGPATNNPAAITSTLALTSVAAGYTSVAVNGYTSVAVAPVAGATAAPVAGNKIVAPVVNGTVPAYTAPQVAPYRGTASRLGVSAAILAGLFGGLAYIL